MYIKHHNFIMYM